jgi:hypothetical protein
MAPVSNLAELPAADADHGANGQSGETENSKNESGKKSQRELEVARQDAVRRRLSSSAPEPVRLLGERYLLFCQPVHLQLEVATADGKEPASEDGLVVCGLRSERGFSAEIQQLPPVGLAVVVGTLILALLAWPLLKLRFVGPQDRLHGFDVRLVIVGVASAAGILTCVLLTAREYNVLASTLNAHLVTIAEGVRQTLVRTMSEASEELKAYDLVMSSAPPWYQDAPPSGEMTMHSTSPELREMMWLSRYDSSGHPTNRWTPRALDGACTLRQEQPPAVNLSEDPIFGDMQNLARAGEEVSFGAVSSSLADEVHFVIARRLREDGSGANFATMSLPLSYLTGPVMRQGFGFALVSSDGTVQLHSESDRSLLENLFTASGEDRRLMAAVLNHRRGLLESVIDYRGAPIRVYVDPIPQRGLSVIAYRAQRPLQTVAAELIASSLVLFFGYLVTLVVLLIFIRLVTVPAVPGGYRAAWLWPSRDQEMVRRYYRAAAMLAATGAATLWLLGRQDGAGTLVVLWGLPVAAVALLRVELGFPDEKLSRSRKVAGGVASAAATLVLVAVSPDALAVGAVGLVGIIWWGQRRSMAAPRPTRDVVAALATLVLAVVLAVAGAWTPAVIVGATLPTWFASDVMPPTLRAWAARTESGFRLGYVSMHLALLCVLAVVPAMALFGDGRNEVLSRLQFNEQKAFADDCHGRASRLASADPPACATPAEWPNDQCGLFAPQDWLPSDGSAPPRPRSDPQSRLRRRLVTHVYERLPAYSSFAASLREAGDAPLALATLSPGREDLAAGIPLVAISAVLALALLWWIARRLFLLDADARGTSDIPAAGARSVWVLGWPHDRPAEPVGNPSPHATVFDLREGGTLALLTAAANRERATSDLVEVDHIEHRLGDPIWEPRMFALLEQMTKRKSARVVLTSDTDPIRHLSARLVEGGGSGANGAADRPGQGLEEGLAHWARMLDLFSIARHDVAEGSKDPVSSVLAEKYRSVLEPENVPADSADDHLLARHWQLWNACSRAERLALRQLAEEGFLSPATVDVVHELMRRGLVSRSPALSLMTASFRRFVLAVDSRETVALWEGESGPSGWTRLRAPLTVALILGGLVFFVTQPQVFNSTIAAVTALVTAVPLLLRVLGVVGKAEPGAVPGTDR